MAPSWMMLISMNGDNLSSTLLRTNAWVTPLSHTLCQPCQQDLDRVTSPFKSGFLPLLTPAVSPRCCPLTSGASPLNKSSCPLSYATNLRHKSDNVTSWVNPLQWLTTILKQNPKSLSCLQGLMWFAYFSDLISLHFPITPLKSHQSSCCLGSTLRAFPPQDLCMCCFFCLEYPFLLDSFMSCILSPFRSLSISCHTMWKNTFITLFSLEYLLLDAIVFYIGGLLIDHLPYPLQKKLQVHHCVFST